VVSISFARWLGHGQLVAGMWRLHTLTWRARRSQRKMGNCTIQMVDAAPPKTDGSLDVRALLYYGQVIYEVWRR